MCDQFFTYVFDTYLYIQSFFLFQDIYDPDIDVDHRRRVLTNAR